MRGFARSTRRSPSATSRRRRGSDDRRRRCARAATESLVDWDDLGVEGRTFVGTGPTAEEIARADGGGRRSSRSACSRGWATPRTPSSRPRSRWPTSSGPAASSGSTSWWSPHRDGLGRAERGERLRVRHRRGLRDRRHAVLAPPLLAVLRRRLGPGPRRRAGRCSTPSTRAGPAFRSTSGRELYVFGESLGSFGGEAAFSGEFDMDNRTSGALLVGPPNFNPLYRSFIEDRDAGSREVEPVYREGRIIRFTTKAERPQPEDEPWTGSRVLYLQHASDPVTWWSPDLLLTRPDWLEETRGDDVPGAMRWIPWITFLQVSADLAAAFSTPPGPRAQLLGRARRRLGQRAAAGGLDAGHHRAAAAGARALPVTRATWTRPAASRQRGPASVRSCSIAANRWSGSVRSSSPISSTRCSR